MKILLDTSVLIDVLRGCPDRKAELANLVRAGHRLMTTAVNVAEIYAGMRVAEAPRTEEFLSGLECLELKLTDARLAGRMKHKWSEKGRTLTLADTMIAAIALENGCHLFTDNRRDFPMPELQLYR